MNWLRFVEQNSYEMENFKRLNKDNSDNMQVNANVTFQLYDVNVQNSNASRRTFLAQKSWTTLKVSMFQSLSVCKKGRQDTDQTAFLLP